MDVNAIASKAGDDTNAVRVNVSYRKGKGIVVDGYPATINNGIVSITLSMLCRTPEALLEPRKTNSKAKLASWEAEVARQVDARSGPAWDVVLSVCEQNQLTVA